MSIPGFSHKIREMGRKHHEFGSHPHILGFFFLYPWIYYGFCMILLWVYYGFRSDFRGFYDGFSAQNFTIFEAEMDQTRSILEIQQEDVASPRSWMSGDIHGVCVESKQQGKWVVDLFVYQPY